MLRDKYPDMPALLAAIREKPCTFLGHRTIRGLDLLLWGIHLAEEIHGLPVDKRLGGFDLPAFERWAQRFSRRRLSLNSFGLAAHCAGDDSNGLDLWFHWYELFASIGSGSADKVESRVAPDHQL